MARFTVRLPSWSSLAALQAMARPSTSLAGDPGMQLSAQCSAGAANISLQVCSDSPGGKSAPPRQQIHNAPRFCQSKASRDGGSAVSTACCLRLFRLGAPLCNGSMHAPPFEQDHPSSRGHVRLPELIAIDNGILAAQ